MKPEMKKTDISNGKMCFAFIFYQITTLQQH
jgi:hypothetical protein